MHGRRGGPDPLFPIQAWGAVIRTLTTTPPPGNPLPLSHPPRVPRRAVPAASYLDMCADLPPSVVARETPTLVALGKMLAHGAFLGADPPPREGVQPSQQPRVSQPASFFSGPPTKGPKKYILNYSPAKAPGERGDTPNHTVWRGRPQHPPPPPFRSRKTLTTPPPIKGPKRVVGKKGPVGGRESLRNGALDFSHRPITGDSP